MKICVFSWKKCANNCVPTHKVQNMVMEKVILRVPESFFVPLSGSGAKAKIRRGGLQLKNSTPLRTYHMEKIYFEKSFKKTNNFK